MCKIAIKNRNNIQETYWVYHQKSFHSGVIILGHIKRTPCRLKIHKKYCELICSDDDLLQSNKEKKDILYYLKRTVDAIAKFAHSDKILNRI